MRRKRRISEVHFSHSDGFLAYYAALPREIEK
jgi:hypothetical protein